MSKANELLNEAKFIKRGDSQDKIDTAVAGYRNLMLAMEKASKVLDEVKKIPTHKLVLGSKEQKSLDDATHALRTLEIANLTPFISDKGDVDWGGFRKKWSRK